MLGALNNSRSTPGGFDSTHSFSIFPDSSPTSLGRRVATTTARVASGRPWRRELLVMRGEVLKALLEGSRFWGFEDFWGLDSTRGFEVWILLPFRNSFWRPLGFWEVLLKVKDGLLSGFAWRGGEFVGWLRSNTMEQQFQRLGTGFHSHQVSGNGSPRWSPLV